MAHKGKATSDVSYNLEDPPEAYTNTSVHTYLSKYTSVARSVRVPEYDASTQDLDAEIVMRVGGGKKHGRYWMGDDIINTASTPSLLDPSTEHERKRPHTPWPSPTQHRVNALEVIPILLIVQ
jgi:hypothetical protein